MNRLAIIVVLVAGGLAACSKKKSDPAPPPPPAPVATPDAAAPAPADAAPADAAPASDLVWTFTVTPATVTMKHIAEPMLSITVTNHGKDVLDASKIQLGFLVNGEESSAMGMMFGNGGTGAEWNAIKPGATGHKERQGLQNFQPGTYEVVLHSEGAELARTTFTLTK